MTHPALENMNYDELNQLIDEATKLRDSKFESREQEDKTLQGNGDGERKVDPFRSPTA